jgi:predicted amidohydrolase
MTGTVHIALAQIAAQPNADARRACLARAVDEAARADAGLIAFPELAGLPFFPQHERFNGAHDLAEAIPGPTTELLAAAAKRHGIVIVHNMYERIADGRAYDSSPVIDADGTLLGVTRMVHITDYACFHERAYYAEGDRGAPVYETAVGKVGVAICYDRHYPEYMRALGVRGAEIVVIPQAGGLDEWPEGMYEAEVRTAALQNGYFTALCNRVGSEERLTFAGESFVSDPEGRVLVRGARCAEDLVLCELDLDLCVSSTARRLFWKDRRPELYGEWMG